MKDPGEGATSRGVTNPDVSEADVAQDSRPCKGCGATIHRTVPVAPIKHYCGPDCRPRCSVESCDKPVHTKGMCSAHATRAARYGDPLAPMTRSRNEGACSVPDCLAPMRKTGYCANHYQMVRLYGEIRDWKFKWAEVGRPCPICGKPTGTQRGKRSVCSPACQGVLSRHGGPPPNPHCARCGVEIDLSAGTKFRAWIRSNVKLCRRCKVHHRTELTPGELANRDGAFCQLCGCDVDLLAVFPDPMRPSVDHIIPKALGGSDAAENNQLSHLRCNQIKSDRHTAPPDRRCAP